MITIKRWTWMTFAGWFIGILLVLTFSIIFDGLGIEGWQFIIGLGMGLGVGALQWLALRGAAGQSSAWIWHTALGLTVPFVLFDMLTYYELLANSPYHIFVSVLLGGLIVGVLQARLFKKQGNPATGWVVSSAAGWALAVLAFWGINYTAGLSANKLLLFVLNLLLMLIGGPVLGYMTGKSLQKIN